MRSGTGRRRSHSNKTLSAQARCWRRALIQGRQGSGSAGPSRRPPPSRRRKRGGSRKWVRTETSCTILRALAGALLRCAPLAVLALRRAARLASHPAMATKLHAFSLHDPKRRRGALLLNVAQAEVLDLHVVVHAVV